MDVGKENRSVDEGDLWEGRRDELGEGWREKLRLARRSADELSLLSLLFTTDKFTLFPPVFFVLTESTAAGISDTDFL